MENSQNITMSDLIGWVETKCNCNAIRFEPAIYENLLKSRTDSQKLLIAKIQETNACSWHTALMIYSTSWGAVQLMGFNIYGVCGYADDINRFMQVEESHDQYDLFYKFTTYIGFGDVTPRALAVSPDARLRFALKYNGGAEYAELIKQALIHYGFAVKG